MRQLSLAETSTAADVLARAFADDPLWQYLLPQRPERILTARQAVRATVPLYARSEQLYGTDGALDGVAVWRPPRPIRPQPSSLLNPSLLTLLVSPFLRALPAAIPIFAQFERMHRQYCPEPHWYLSTIGVVPEAQGRGLASQRIRPILALADRERCSAYTETMTPSNVPLYEHYGFRCMEQYHVPGTDLSIWSFHRSATHEQPE